MVSESSVHGHLTLLFLDYGEAEHGGEHVVRASWLPLVAREMRERDRDRQTERQRDRQTDRQRDRQRERERKIVWEKDTVFKSMPPRTYSL
jgi:hypothetical protein